MTTMRKPAKPGTRRKSQQKELTMPSETLQQLCERSAKLRGWEEEIERVIAKSGHTIERAFKIGCVGDFVTTQEIADTKSQVLKLLMYLAQIAAALEYKHATKIETGQ